MTANIERLTEALSTDPRLTQEDAEALAAEFARIVEKFVTEKRDPNRLQLMMSGGGSKPVLTIALRAYRERAGKTQKEVAAAIGCSLSKIMRIEAGQVGISVPELTYLLSFYGETDQAIIDDLLKFAGRQRKDKPEE